MNIINRKIFSYTLVILLIASPWAVGLLLQNQYIKAIAHLNNQLPIELSISEFKRGYLSSYIQLSVQARDQSQPILIEQTLLHGPLVHDSETKGIEFQWLLGKLKTKLPIQLLSFSQNHLSATLQAHTNIGFTQKANTYFYQSQSTLDQTWTGQLEHDLKFTKLSGRIDIPELNFNFSPCQANALKNSIILDTHQANDVVLGKRIFVSEDFAVACQKTPIAQFKAFEINSNTTLLNDKNISIQLGSSSQKSHFLAQTYQDDLLSLEINPIALDTFQWLKALDLSQDISQHASYLLEQLSNSQTTFQATLPKYLTQNLISFIALLMNGESLTNPNATLSFETLNAATYEKFNKLIKDNILVEQDKNYDLNIKFSDNTIELNNKPLNLSEWQLP